MFTEVHSAFVEFLYMFGSFMLNVYFGVKNVFHNELVHFDYTW